MSTTENILQRIKEKKALLYKNRPLSKVILNRLTEQLNLEWTYNSNAIEGNSLTLRETKLLIEQGITIKGKSLREHFEAQNHQHAIEFLSKLVQKSSQITENIILNIQTLVLDRIEEDFKGRYRNGRVRIIGANFIPPNSRKVPELMKNLVTWTKKQMNLANPVTLATHFHHKFVWIHPFFDGNGRTGRLLMNLILMQAGFPPAIILKNDRFKYYEALNLANNGNYQKLELLVAQAVERSLDLHLEACGGYQSTEYDYISLRDLAKSTPFSQDYLSLLARQGKIDAFKESRNWVSNPKAISDYLQNKRKTSPLASK